MRFTHSASFFQEPTWRWTKSFRTICPGWSPVVTVVRRTQETWANYFFVKNVCQILRKAFEVWKINSASGFNSDLLFGANAERIHSTAWIGLSRSNSVRSISRASAASRASAGTTAAEAQEASAFASGPASRPCHVPFFLPQGSLVQSLAVPAAWTSHFSFQTCWYRQSLCQSLYSPRHSHCRSDLQEIL